MNEPFEIPVWYKNRELLFPARLLIMGYVHKFRVDIYGQEMLFEQDDNGEYRALADIPNMEGAKNLDAELLKAIAVGIETILK